MIDKTLGDPCLDSEIGSCATFGHYSKCIDNHLDLFQE